MPTWNQAYLDDLEEYFDGLVVGLDDRIEGITTGRTVPALEDMSIGSGRHVRASVMFFDICGFSARTSRDDLATLGETLYMLDCVVPTVMRVVFDHGGYIEKNTGDGVMAIMGVGCDAKAATTSAVNAAVVSLYVIKTIVNPHLLGIGIEPVEVSFGIDFGSLLLARIGSRRGGAKQSRSHITAVGPTANIAFELQEAASANEIMVGDLVYDFADKPSELFDSVDLPDWRWTIGSDEGERDDDYYVWRYRGRRSAPPVLG